MTRYQASPGARRSAAWLVIRALSVTLRRRSPSQPSEAPQAQITSSASQLRLLIAMN